MPVLKVPGARIHVEKRGEGPLLLLIPGGNGDAGPYEGVAELLADRFTVVSYDRRGFSRSPLDGPVDREGRPASDVEDAAALIDAYGGGSGYVFGSSSGAIVALHLVAAHPERVRTAVAHEPPLLTVLPDADAWRGVFAEVERVYRAEGVPQAMAFFGERMGFGGLARARDFTPTPEQLEGFRRASANMVFWLENELPVYPEAEPDLEVLAGLAAEGKVVLAGGEESREFFPYLPNAVLAERWGTRVVDFPGNHVGYMLAPGAFAERLAGVLEGR